MAAEEKAKQDAIAAAARAEAEKQAAIQAEKGRQEAEARAAAEAEEKRKADSAHRASINRAAYQSLIERCQISEEVSKSVIREIATGQIPNVKILY